MSRPILSPSAGLGLKPQHFRSALDATKSGLWFEVHAENYMIEGGPRLAWLDAIAAKFPLSLHGVGLSLGGIDPIDQQHLTKLKSLVDRYEPALVSEHVAWCQHDGINYADLLAPPLTRASLDRFCERVDQVQNVLGRRILMENPSHYLAFHAEMSEPDFLNELARRTGCGLLIDINNIHVSANNLGTDARAYLEEIDADQVGEYHLAGHEADSRLGDALLIDTHGAPVADPVWSLYAQALDVIGPRPTLIERDNNIPVFEELLTECGRAGSMLAECMDARAAHV